MYGLQIWLRVIAAAALLYAPHAGAHESRPLYVELEALSAGTYSLDWKVPPSVPVPRHPAVRLSANCSALLSAPSAAGQPGLYRCASPPHPEYVQVEYPAGNPALSTLVKLSPADGVVQMVHTDPAKNRIALPGPQSLGDVLLEYLRLGLWHILTGYDHLLFVACLIFLARTRKRIVLAVSGFTVAHSITLALAALGITRVSVMPVEAAIALSIVFLAAEILRGPATRSLTWRYPVLVSSVFGLLHGLGFAAVLGAIGLPEGRVFAALAAFNLGVEAGQLLFILLLVALYSAARRILPVVAAAPARLAMYPVGALAGFWLVQRVAGFGG